MSSVVTRVLDDSFFNTELVAKGCNFYNATMGFPETSLAGAFNKTIMLHQGTFIEFYGFTPSEAYNQTFRVSNPTSGDSTLEYPEPGTGGLFYTTLSDVLVQFDGPLLLFDYAVASVTELEILHDQTIIVDDSNTEIQWGGNWEEKRNYTLNRPLGFQGGSWGATVNARPHGNGTHESDKVGDYFIFQFQGSSILVGGITPQNRTDPIYQVVLANISELSSFDNFHLKLNFTLDGYSQAAVFTGETISQPVGTPHFPYFQNDSLAEGNHTLVMTVDDVTGNTSVVIDYLTYKPSFATLKDKPIFPPIILNGNSTSSPDPPSDPPPGPRSNTATIIGRSGKYASLTGGDLRIHQQCPI
ncbi:hypothetical protein K435DRAFT_877696 [Dendrothele bispora CBS 962.96]|uniref:Uncharacterized protein n=1 Tax=Dendrothele bispora (strain CBS 962.96) TaxID=1314807 RepID=A0A4S8KPF8_DENBC|nr:hypothetical protein K435DRAFT_877696 [Dendrothele bispora CBS 962.96]